MPAAGCRDLIKDFQVGVDRIEIDAINGFDALTITDNAKGHAVVDLGGGDSITLKGVSKASPNARTSCSTRSFVGPRMRSGQQGSRPPLSRGGRGGVRLQPKS